MAKTRQLDLPLLMPSQAQKHVTVNEALARLDAAVQLQVLSSIVTTPPETAVDGTTYLVPSDGSGAWVGMSGRIAIWSNGGWDFLAPKAGWRAWDVAQARSKIYDGVDWIADGVAVSTEGAATTLSVIEFDHAVGPGPTNSTSVSIPGQAALFGVTGRVISPVTGSGLASWRLGVGGSDNRYGAGLGLAKNSYVVGLSGSPVTYYSATPLLLTAEGGTFGGGIVRLALHILQVLPPRSV